jgi:hypothetical protein
MASITHGPGVFRQVLDNTRDEASQSTGSRRAREMNGAAKAAMAEPAAKAIQIVRRYCEE